MQKQKPGVNPVLPFTHNSNILSEGYSPLALVLELIPMTFKDN